MCQFKSGLWTKKRLIWDLDVDSHEDLIKLKGFKDDGVKTEFVRVEYSPKDWIKFLTSPKTYKDFELKIDQDILPDWFIDKDRKQIEKDFKEVIKKVIKERFVLQGQEIDRIENGNWYVNGGTINYVSGGTIKAVRGGTINDVSGGTINEVSGGTINAVNGGTIKAVRGGTINDVNCGTINAIWSGTINYVSGGTIKAISNNAFVIYRDKKEILIPAGYTVKNIK